MKKTLLSIFTVAALFASTNAQTYTPAPGPIANGEVGTAYAGETINAAIPTTVDITGQDIIDILPPQAATFASQAINPTDVYTVTVTASVLTVEGLPAGLSDDCNGCSVNAGGNEDITISGTPTESGNFNVVIATATTGETTVDLPVLLGGGSVSLPFGGAFTVPVVGTQFDIPALPGALDSDEYTMNVTSTGIEESNDVFSLGFYPNPTIGDATLEVKTIESGIASVEVYSITGSRVLSTSESISVGLNRISVDLNSVPAGIYLIKADINGTQALIRTQKI